MSNGLKLHSHRQKDKLMRFFKCLHLIHDSADVHNFFLFSFLANQLCEKDKFHTARGKQKLLIIFKLICHLFSPISSFNCSFHLGKLRTGSNSSFLK